MKQIDTFLKESKQVNEGLESIARKFQNIFTPVVRGGKYGVLIGNTFKYTDDKTYNLVIGFCDAIFGRVDMGGRSGSLPALWEEYEDEYGTEPTDDDVFGYIYFPGSRDPYPYLCNMNDYTII